MTIPSVPILLPSVLAPHANGQREFTAHAHTVVEALDQLTAAHPALATRVRDSKGDIYPFVTIYVNDDDVRLDGGLSRLLTSGDEIVIVPAVAGG